MCIHARHFNTYKKFWKLVDFFGLFNIQSVRNNGNLTDTQSRLIDLYIHEFIRSGAELKETQKKGLSTITKNILKEQDKYRWRWTWFCYRSSVLHFCCNCEGGQVIRGHTCTKIYLRVIKMYNTYVPTKMYIQKCTYKNILLGHQNV